jgi:hypothetical protein
MWTNCAGGLGLCGSCSAAVSGGILRPPTSPILRVACGPLRRIEKKTRIYILPSALGFLLIESPGRRIPAGTPALLGA